MSFLPRLRRGSRADCTHAPPQPCRPPPAANPKSLRTLIHPPAAPFKRATYCAHFIPPPFSEPRFRCCCIAAQRPHRQLPTSVLLPTPPQLHRLFPVTPLAAVGGSAALPCHIGLSGTRRGVRHVVALHTVASLTAAVCWEAHHDVYRGAQAAHLLRRRTGICSITRCRRLLAGAA